MQQTIVLAGRALTAHRSGALYCSHERTLIVADLHLEKGSAFARHGQMLPPYDTRVTLAALAAVIDFFDARTVVALGDSFHDDGGSARIGDEDRAVLAGLQRGRTWAWVTGNHDPSPDASLGGEITGEIDLDGVVLRHEPRPGEPRPEIAGHLHPVARLLWNGTSVRRRCFASDRGRIVMPAFGAFTGGLNLISEPFSALFASGPSRVDMLSTSGIYPVPTSALIGD